MNKTYLKYILLTISFFSQPILGSSPLQELLLRIQEAGLLTIEQDVLTRSFENSPLTESEIAFYALESCQVTNLTPEQQALIEDLTSYIQIDKVTRMPNLAGLNAIGDASSVLIGNELSLATGNVAVEIVASPSTPTDYSLTLPVDAGTAGYVLQTAGSSGILSWTSVSAITGNVLHQNGDNYTPEVRMGSSTGNANPVSIITNGIDRITTDSNGAVTINQAAAGNSLTVTGTMVVNGNLLVTGSTTTIETTTLLVSDKTITVNYGEPGAGVGGDGIAGIIVDRGTLPEFQFVFDENYDNFRVGQIGQLQPVATRQDDPIQNGVAYWNSTLNRFDTRASVTINDFGSLSINQGNALVLNNSDDFSTALQSYPSLTTTYTLRLPANVGTANYVLTTDGNNPAQTSWTSPTTILSGTFYQQGGNNFGTTGILGLTSANTLNIITDDTPRIAITSTGNVTVNAPASGVTLAINGATDSTAAIITSGAVTTQLALAVTGSSTLNGNVTVQGNNTLFLTDTATGYIGFKAPATVTIPYSLTWPANPGSNNFVLQTDGSGILSWTSITALIPSGSTNILQDGNSFGTAVRVGSADNQNFDLITNQINRVVIDTNGGVTVNQPTNATTVGLTVNGATGATGITIAQNATQNAIQTGNGSATAPAYSFTLSNTTGMYSSAQNNLDFATNGAQRLNINSTGNVTVETGNLNLAANATQLIFHGNSQPVALQASVSTNAPGYTLTLPIDAGTNGYVLETDGSGILSWTAGSSLYSGTFYKQGGNDFGALGVLGLVDSNTLNIVTNNVARLVLNTQGNVAIQQPTTSTAVALTVNGATSATAANISAGAAGQLGLNVTGGASVSGQLGAYTSINDMFTVGQPNAVNTEAGTSRQVQTALDAVVSFSDSGASSLTVFSFPAASFTAGLASSGLYVANIRNTDKSIATVVATAVGMTTRPDASNIRSTLISSALPSGIQNIYSNSTFSNMTVGQQAAVTALGVNLSTNLVLIATYGASPSTQADSCTLQMFNVG